MNTWVLLWALKTPAELWLPSTAPVVLVLFTTCDFEPYNPCWQHSLSSARLILQEGSCPRDTAFLLAGPAGYIRDGNSTSQGAWAENNKPWDPTRSSDSLCKCAFCHWAQRADGLTTHMYLSGHGNNPFQSLMSRAQETLGFHPLRGKGSTGSTVPLAAKHKQALCDPAGLRPWTAKASLSRHWLLKNPTDCCFCCFSLAFQLHTKNNDLKHKKPSVSWKIHYLAVYIFSNNPDVSVYLAFFPASHNPHVQYPCQLFRHYY